MATSFELPRPTSRGPSVSGSWVAVRPTPLGGSGSWPILPPSVDRVRRRFRLTIVQGLHVAFTGIAFAGAFVLRHDFQVPEVTVGLGVRVLPALVALRLGVLTWRKVHRASWRHAGVRDLAALATATTISTALFAGVLALAGLLGAVPRSVLLLDWLLFMFLAGGARFGARLAHEGHLPKKQRGTRTLVIGAGEAAERFLRQSMHVSSGQSHFVGLLDDDPSLRRLMLHGVSVLGTIDELPRLVRQLKIEQVVIAIPSANGEQLRRIVRRCSESRVTFKTLPSQRELLDGEAKIGQVRDVQIEDLLGRDPVHLDLGLVERDLANRTVLVTGGAGSIGSELARQIAGFCPARLILFEQAESSLYFIHLELSRAYPGLDIVPVVGDVTNVQRLNEVFDQYRPDYVFHAAAYKHVPMMERNVCEAVRNNVLGTLNTAEAAARYRAKKFVLISTDKAVNPSSVMGATKRLAELIVLYWPNLRASETDFRAVRFGNVLGSEGSVIPVFKKQLAAGGPITVTHPDMTRYFMTIPEAVQLVLQAAALPEAGRRITLLDMGEPVKISDLAEQLIRLSGLVPNKDVHIVYTGLRPGEKLFEELASLVEAGVPTSVEKIRILQTPGIEGEQLRTGIARLSAGLVKAQRDALVREMQKMIPEFVLPTHEAEPVRRNAREFEARITGPFTVPAKTPTMPPVKAPDDAYRPAALTPVREPMREIAREPGREAGRERTPTPRSTGVGGGKWAEPLSA